ncbi:hypothetical protein niasHT_031879 [Heterodera trifolii]|uniref:G-patch domain-containing protein n=1 Tax=Heterodera trifolii TaxID=157864 RepID=A0ABD2I284_9BILA
MNDWLLSSAALHENVAQNGDTAANGTQQQQQPLSIAEMVTQAAAQVVQQQHSDQLASLGFRWADEWALFYNAETGYFYEPNSALFSHPSAPHLCYKFNADTGQYDQIGGDGSAAGAQIESSASSSGTPKWSKRAFRRRANRILGDDFVQNAGQEEVDVAELTLDLVDRCSFLVGGECYEKRSAKRALMERAAAVDDDEIWAGVSSSFSSAPRRSAAADGDASGSGAEEDSDGAWSSGSRTERQNEEIARRQQEEEIARNAPCIRLVERPRGRLHIVTICGARVGFGRSMDVQIGGDANAANGDAYGTPQAGGGEQAEGEEEELLAIRYSAEEGVYRMEWHSCTVCAQKDGDCLEPGVSHTVRHEDVVSIGTAEQIWLSFHIHSGLNTCQGCEPGLFPTGDGTCENDGRPKKRRSLHTERLRQMRALKEQYGLLDQDIDCAEMDAAELRRKYVDRAGRRRRAVGSELPLSASVRSSTVLNEAGGIYAHCVATPQPGCSPDSVRFQQQLKDGVGIASAAAAATVPINAENKGFKLLKGMGWAEGQGLGKHSQGIQAPIATQFKGDRVGLGTVSSTTTATTTPFSTSSKISINLRSKQQRNAEQMRKRIEQFESRR